MPGHTGPGRSARASSSSSGIVKGGKRERARRKKNSFAYWDFFFRTKIFKSNQYQNLTLLLDGLYLSLCVELSFDGTRELLVGVLGIAYLGGKLLASED